MRRGSKSATKLFNGDKWSFLKLDDEKLGSKETKDSWRCKCTFISNNVDACKHHLEIIKQTRVLSQSSKDLEDQFKSSKDEIEKENDAALDTFFGSIDEEKIAKERKEIEDVLSSYNEDHFPRVRFLTSCKISFNLIKAFRLLIYGE